jgi:hypothetical protein
LVFLGQHRAGQQVGPPRPRTAKGFFSPPAADLLVVPGEEDFRDFHPAKRRRTSIVGIIEQPLPEGVLAGRGLIPQRTGKEARGRLDDDQGRQLSAGEDVIADGDLLVHRTKADPLVDPFIPAAEEDNPPSFGRQPPGRLLGEPLPLGGEEDHPGRIPRRTERLHGPEDRLRLEHHPRAAAVGDVVGDPVTSLGPVPQVVDPDAQEPFLLRAAEQALLERRSEDPGEQGQNLNLQHPPATPVAGQ